MTALAKEKFKKSYLKLTSRERCIVDNVQVQRQTWVNDHYRMTVQSMKCKGTMVAPPIGLLGDFVSIANGGTV